MGEANTKIEVEKMMKEDTGRDILDSGDYYGRHFEINRTVKSFDDLKYVDYIATTSKKKIIVYFSTNIYNFLIDHLEFDESLTNALYKLAENSGTNKYDFASMSKLLFNNILNERYLIDNSYNYNNSLSQDFEFSMSIDDLENTVLLVSLHNGCDIRGGYTMPRVFRVLDKGIGYDFLQFGSGYYMECSCPEQRYVTHGDRGYFPKTWKVTADSKLKCAKCNSEVRIII